MAEVIGVRFKEVGKVYYFDPLDNKLSAGDMVIVETARGLECGKVTFVTLRKTNLRRKRHTEFASRKLQTTNLK